MRYTVIGCLTALALAYGCTTQSAGRPASDDNGDANTDSNVNDQTTSQRFTLVAATVGGGSVDPAAGTFDSGEDVTLTAAPDEGWRFDRWEGDATGTEPVITITVIKNTSLTAFFVKLPTPPPPDNLNDNQDDPGNVNDNDTVDPGDDFDSAAAVEFDAGGLATLNETLLRAADVHVYSVGAMALGDFFSADCVAQGAGDLDPMIALFDADGYRVFWNDDVDLAGGDFSAHVSGLIRHDSPECFLAVTSTDFAETSGDYRLTLEVQRGVGTPSISGHTVVIDFDGAASNVVIAGEDWGTPVPFDAASIEPGFAGQTETLKQMILSIVRADFAAFDLTVLSTDDPAPASPFTTAFIGGDDDELFGIADGLDFYNESHDDNVIIFAAAFSPLTNDLDEMGQAIGNVVSHEIGHSLGLMHTLEGTELMDNSGSDFPLLSDQSFGTATLDDFPIGLQNAPLLLDESLGASAKRIPGHFGRLRCGTCGLPLSKIARQQGAGGK